MAGFLDKKTRVWDAVLTGHGRTLLSQGRLDFAYWGAFDDEVDYVPYVHASASLSSEEYHQTLRGLIEGTPVMEAVPGRRVPDHSGSERIGMTSVLFDVPPGVRRLPVARFHSGSVLLSGSQNAVTIQGRRSKDGSANVQTLGYEQVDGDEETLEFFLEGDLGDSPEGFHFRFFLSGSSGLREVFAKRDDANDLSFGLGLVVHTGKLAGN